MRKEEKEFEYFMRALFEAEQAYTVEQGRFKIIEKNVMMQLRKSKIIQLNIEGEDYGNGNH